RLLQFADSALPVGSASHSFGLESLFHDGLVTPGELERFLRGYLEESGALDASYCRAAYQLSPSDGAEFTAAWQDLNERVSARKAPRESREASLALGRRFLGLAGDLLGAGGAAGRTWLPSHHVTAFGLVAAYAGVDERSAVLGWLHQSTSALVSAAQRLAPI